MRHSWILLVLAIGCGKHDDKAPASGGPPDTAACAKYAQNTAELMYVGFERGGKQSKYIKAELLAAMVPDLTKVCATVPPAHATCVGKAKTAEEADACSETISPEQMQKVRAELARIVKAAGPAAIATVATADECAKASEVMAKDASKLPAGATRPSAAAIAQLCVSAKWGADFARCEASGDPDCRALPIVGQGLAGLVAGETAK